MALVKNSLKSLSPNLVNGGASLPDIYLFTWNGAEVIVRFSEYESQLSLISSSIIFVATVIAFRVLLGGF